MSPDQLAHFNRRLLQQQRELEILKASRAEVSSGTGADQCIPGRVNDEAMEGHALMLTLEKRAAQTLREIDAALKRVDSGEFGECTACGEDIAPARLEADPKQALCIGCASRKERR